VDLKAKKAMEKEAVHLPAIALHGGAGNLKKLNLTSEQEREYINVMEFALNQGYALLKNGHTSTEAVEAVIMILEDSPLFNAGKGAVFNHDGVNELDAAIMDGNTMDAAAVAGLRRIKNPIQLARRIMDSSKFVFLSGTGAEEFATEQGFDFVEQYYFFTEHRWQQLQESLKEKSTKLDHSENLDPYSDHESKFGTVGCVALDRYGNLAAGTSTGGITNKQYGRIGDSPVIGAGTYANNNSCAISCTGKGEDFIRLGVAHDISSRMLYLKEPLAESVKYEMKILKEFGGRGGCIALNAQGEVSFGFTTNGMFRGSINQRGELFTGIYE
jgi:beta-aspartyl-peptidase (threonine type)